MANELITLDIIQERIFTIRGKRVMLDRDLAALYEVPTKVLNQAVKRNIERFPSDFMFKLNYDELKELVTICDRFKTLKHSTNPPYAFTEHGVTMLSGVLNSKKAIEINVQVVRAFIVLRQFAAESRELAQRLSELEHYFIEHCKDNDSSLQEIYNTLNLLMDRTKPARIGFKTSGE